MNASIGRLLAVVLLLGATAGFSDSSWASPVRVMVSPTTAALPFLQMAREGALRGVELKVDFFANHAQALAILLRWGWPALLIALVGLLGGRVDVA